MTKANAVVPTTEQFLKAYAQFLQDLQSAARSMGEMLVQMVAADGDTLDKLVECGCQRYMLNKLYRIGLGLEDARLIADFSPAAELVAELPLGQQQKILAEGLPVVVEATPAGQGVTKLKPMALLTEKDCRRVFREDGSVRPPQEQTEMLRKEKQELHVLPADRYQFSDDGETIEVLAKTSFTLSRWMEIGEMAKSKQMQFLQRNMSKRQIDKRALAAA